ncbi:polyhydroxyalkanoate synthesis repressor PhaR [Qipengyuania sediminis]|uniref:polyhydroxyalkanoate synthesis repressor PhaR n=1 Tax=Qipengyuania sediminis TaxID=1532023 RepID=UPI00105AA1F8|nr:polyhydroxyalkanoate synthesis repressor PhaR [Qipengyuania sediminis]
MAKRAEGGGTVVIKKYANRRLYDTDTSSYITLEDIAAMVRAEVDLQVVDAKTGEDITHQILTQIILDQEASGSQQMLPVSFLRDLIGMYGNSVQAMVPGYLEASMATFRKNREELTAAWQQGLAANPFAKLAETNIAMMRAAAEAFMPPGKPTPPPKSPAPKDDLAALREQMADMQSKLDKLSK